MGHSMARSLDFWEVGCGLVERFRLRVVVASVSDGAIPVDGMAVSVLVEGVGSEEGENGGLRRMP